MRTARAIAGRPYAALAVAVVLALAAVGLVPNRDVTVPPAGAPVGERVLTAAPDTPGETAIHLLTAGHAGVGTRVHQPAPPAAPTESAAAAVVGSPRARVSPSRSPAPPGPLHVLHCRWLI